MATPEAGIDTHYTLAQDRGTGDQPCGTNERRTKGCMLARSAAWYNWLQTGGPSSKYPLFFSLLRCCPDTCVSGYTTGCTHLAASEVQPQLFGS